MAVEDVSDRTNRSSDVSAADASGSDGTGDAGSDPDGAGAPGDSDFDGSDRLRAAGVGVGLGGVLLGVAALVAPFHLAAGVVCAAAVGAFLARERLPVGYAIGVGAVGGIGLVEATPGIGLGLDAFTLAALAVVFGLLDAVAGSVLGRVRS